MKYQVLIIAMIFSSASFAGKLARDCKENSQAAINEQIEFDSIEKQKIFGSSSSYALVNQGQTEALRAAILNLIEQACAARERTLEFAQTDTTTYNDDPYYGLHMDQLSSGSYSGALQGGPYRYGIHD
ncbi:MAG: hypothetical protein ACPGJV_05325 [Bacteriovoracaceae bacterium]